MVGSDHDLDYPPYLNRQQPPSKPAPQQPTGTDRLRVVIWTLATIAVAAIIVILIVAS
jgi:hypothetical protein